MHRETIISPYTLDLAGDSEVSLLESFRGKRLFFDGVFKGDYSLAIVNRHLVHALIQLGINVVCHTPEDDWEGDSRLLASPDIMRRMSTRYPEQQRFDVHLRNTWPPETSGMLGRVNAYVGFAWEELEFPQHLVARFNRDLDFVLVTSNFVKRALIQSGVATPVEVIGNGCDHLGDIGPEAESPLPVTDRARILHVSSCFPRKGPDLLVEAFLREFNHDDSVELVVKTFPNPDNIIESVIDRISDRLERAPPINVISTYCGNEELRALYRTAAMVVAPSRGEGFGLPLAEAMMFDVPVVTTNYSGQTDFCRPDTSWLVDFNLVPSHAHVAGSFSIWAEPAATHLGKQMRAVLDAPDEARARCRNARALLGAHFKWRDVAVRIFRALAMHPSKSSGPKRLWDIDLISSWRQQCGIATYAEHLYGSQPFSGRLSHIFSRRIIDDELPSEGGETVEAARGVSRLWGYDLTSLMRLIRQLPRGQADVLWMQHHPGHFSTPDMEAIARILPETGHRLHVVTMHSVKEAMRGGSLEWTKAFDIVFVHSAEDAAELSSAGHPNPIVVPHGMRPPATETPTPDPSQFTIGSFGFLMPHKNIDRLVLAFAQARRYEPRLRLKLLNCMLPNDESRLARAMIENLIDSLGLLETVSARFDFISESELANELARCNLLAFPYGPSTETATGAVRVAIGADRPLLCSRSPVLRDVWPTSHVLGSTEVECIAEALIGLAQNQELLSLYDEDRRQLARWYSYPRIATRYVAAIESMLEERNEYRRVA